MRQGDDMMSVNTINTMQISAYLTPFSGKGAIYNGHRQKTKRRIRRQINYALQEAGALLWHPAGGA